jgi:hypothetical protein
VVTDLFSDLAKEVAHLQAEQAKNKARQTAGQAKSSQSRATAGRRKARSVNPPVARVARDVTTTGSLLAALTLRLPVMRRVPGSRAASAGFLGLFGLGMISGSRSRGKRRAGKAEARRLQVEADSGSAAADAAYIEAMSYVAKANLVDAAMFRPTKDRTPAEFGLTKQQVGPAA